MFITDRGIPANILLSIEEYQRIVSQHRSIVDALTMRGLSDLDVELPRSREVARPADLS